MVSFKTEENNFGKFEVNQASHLQIKGLRKIAVLLFENCGVLKIHS